MQYHVYFYGKSTTPTSCPPLRNMGLIFGRLFLGGLHQGGFIDQSWYLKMNASCNFSHMYQSLQFWWFRHPKTTTVWMVRKKPNVNNGISTYLSLNWWVSLHSTVMIRVAKAWRHNFCCTEASSRLELLWMDGWMDGWMHVFPTFLGDKMGKHHYDTAIFTPTSPKSFRKYSNFKNRRKEETKTKLIPDFKLFIKMHHKKWPGFPRTTNTPSDLLFLMPPKTNFTRFFSIKNRTTQNKSPSVPLEVLLPPFYWEATAEPVRSKLL